jgi:uncharacterized protein with FMN-binding domain
MRRSLLWLMGLVCGTALLIGLKSPAIGGGQPSTLAGAPLDPGSHGSGGTVPAAGGPGASSGPSGVPRLSTGPSGVPQPSSHPPSGGATPTRTTPGGGPTTPATQTSTATTAPSTTVTVTGESFAVITAQSPNTKSSPCGPCHDYAILVTITVTNGHITSASTAYDTSPAGSLSYANRASSSLSQTILNAQTWNLGNVSGATYSTNAWEQSVRDAMVKAGLPT